jgi:hypothetical protein
MLWKTFFGERPHGNTKKQRSGIKKTSKMKEKFSRCSETCGSRDKGGMYDCFFSFLHSLASMCEDDDEGRK